VEVYYVNEGNKKGVTVSASELIGYLEQKILDDRCTNDEFELYNTYRIKENFHRFNEKNKNTLFSLKMKYLKEYKQK
jgi:predicted transport protein